MKKYEFTGEGCRHNGHILRRIRATRDFGDVKSGDLGGWLESEENLSDYGDCWVFDDAQVFGNAKVCANAKLYGHAILRDHALAYGDAEIFDNVEVFGNAKIFDKADLYGGALVYGNSQVSGNAIIGDEAKLCGDASVWGNAVICNSAEVASDQDYIVFKNWWSSGRYFTWTRSNNMWKVGCFYGTGKELVTKAYKDSAKSGREYERIVLYVKTILTDKF